MRAALIPILLLCAAPAWAQTISKADKASVIAWVKQTLADPYSLRSTGISDRTVVNGVTVVCVEFNAKNSYGGYVGIYRKPFVDAPYGLQATANRRDVDTGTCWHPSIVMRPFPELGAIK